MGRQLVSGEKSGNRITIIGEEIFCDYCNNKAEIKSIEVKIPPPPGAIDIGKVEEFPAFVCPNCNQTELLQRLPSNEWHNQGYHVGTPSVPIPYCEACKNEIILPAEYYECEYIYYNHIEDYQAVGYRHFHKNCIVLKEKTPETKSSTTIADKDKVKKNNCFIATACYGSPYAKEVLFLKDYRDNVLNQSFWGRLFVQMYYRISPKAANFIADRPFIKKIIRESTISPLVNYLKKIKMTKNEEQ